jgi:hypothetical protein
MRIGARILLSASFFFLGIACYAQDPCSVRPNPRANEKSLTSAELAHRVLLQVAPEKWRDLSPGDVEFILRCGTQQDADEFFPVLHNTARLMPGAQVLEAYPDAIRVSWEDGFKPNLDAFWFRFDSPLAVVPRPGDKVNISGTFSSYSRSPFQINMKSSSFVVPHPLMIMPRQ